MNKKVLLENLNNIMNSMKKTISSFESILASNEKYSLEQIEGEIALLQVKLQNDNNYKKVSQDCKRVEVLLRNNELQQDSLVAIIGCPEIDIKALGQEIDEVNDKISSEQKEIEALANGLAIADNPEEVKKLIDDKISKIAELKLFIEEKTKEINNKSDEIKFYKNKIEELKVKEQEYIDELSSIQAELEKQKSKDINKLNRFLSVRDCVISLNSLNSLYLEFVTIRELLNNSRIDMNLVESKIDNVRSEFIKFINEIMYFVNLINLEELKEEKEKINDRVVSKNGYVLSAQEREDVEKEMANLELAISLYDNIESFDSVVISSYANQKDFLKNEIDDKVFNCDYLQNQVNYLSNKNLLNYMNHSQSEFDSVSKEIKTNEQKVKNIRKINDKYEQRRLEMDNILTFVKKKMKGTEFLRENKVTELKNVREISFSRPTSKYDLSEDKKELTYIELIFMLVQFSNDVLRRDYIKQIDSIGIEKEPIYNVDSFYMYENLALLYEDDFIMKARENMEKMLTEEVLSPEDVVNELNLQGVTVKSFGKSLKTMEETKEAAKTIVL